MKAEDEPTNMNVPAKEDTKDESRDDEKSKVSSTAIVKYVEGLPILPYAKLRQDTDLNIAPANWLRDGRFDKTFPEKGNPLNFSSFGIAHTFLDTIGDVDVISDAENIKKLLKMAYSKAELSLVVHRVQNTLLLDDLDLTAFLSYVSEQGVCPSNLSWLYDFYCEQRGIPKDRHFKKKKNKDVIKQRNIFSKFLHYSVQQEPHDQTAFSLPEEASIPSNTTYQRPGTRNSTSSPTEPTKLSLQKVGTQIVPERSAEIQSSPSRPTQNKKSAQEIVDPQPSGKCPGSPGRSTRKQSGEPADQQPRSPPLSERLYYPARSDTLEDDVLPEPQQMSSFQRNVLWKFEDLHMLVGSNVPIFGGGKYPAVSLRLRECGKPINVLTGLDYWLDNLMCNVPEVAMCYHLDGIVQYYDLFKTEELPQLDGSTFSPKVVKDIAQNVLSFMKSNCTQEGHTYWLFKASDSEVVKLYDLTSICDEKTHEKQQNPFTIPVAMLFYRVAKNMMKQTVLDAGDQSIVRLLLDNCVVLLDDQMFPEIVTSANMLLSNLYSPDNIHTLPSLDHSNNTSQEDLATDHKQDHIEELTDVMASKGSLEVGELSTPGMYQDDIRQVAKLISNNAEERCKKALSHIIEGLRCLKLGLSTDQEAEEMDDLRSQPDSSHGNQATNAKGAYSLRRITALEPTSSQLHSERVPDERAKNPLILVKPVQWRSQSKTLLLRRATSVCHSMACLSNTKAKYGRGLRYCQLSFECLQAYRACDVSKFSEDVELIRSINCACADSYLMLAKCSENLEVHREDFVHRSPDEREIGNVARECLDEVVDNYASKVEFKRDIRDNLITSAEFYGTALDLTGDDTKEDEFFSLARRVGNVKNELGVYFMNQAVAIAGRNSKLSEQRELWKRSFAYFESGIKAFESIDDRANSALLYSNSGRLMRLCAQAVGGRLGVDQSSREEFSTEEKTFFKQSIEFYNRALQSLAERSACPDVWDAVTWELSGAYFTMATLLQDYPPLSVLSQQEVEKEVTELMMKALKICEPTGKATVANIRPHSPRELEKRIGSIHHRLASLYHNAYRNEVSEHTKKKLRSLADLHYTKACLYFRAGAFPCEWIRIHLERVAMCEYQLSFYNSGSNASLKTLEAALDFILESGKALTMLKRTEREPCEATKDSIDDNTTQKVEGKESTLVSIRQETEDGRRNVNPPNDKDVNYQNELEILLPILEARLNSILKETVKSRSQKKSQSKEANIIGLKRAKRMYSLVLRECTGKHKEGGIARAQILSDVLSKLEVIKLETQPLD